MLTTAPPRTLAETIAETKWRTPHARLALLWLRHVRARNSPASPKAIAEAIGCTLKTAYNAVNELAEARLVRPVDGPGATRYEPT